MNLIAISSFALITASVWASNVDGCRQKADPQTLLPVRIGQKYGYVDRIGHIVIKPQFESVQQFSEGRAFVWFGGRSHGYIDETGNVVARTDYAFADDDTAFHEGLAPSCVVRCVVT